MLTCVHDRAVAMACPHCVALSWTVRLDDADLADATRRAEGICARAVAFQAQHHKARGVDGAVYVSGDAGTRRNHQIGAVAEWGAARALDLAPPDPTDLARVGLPDLGPDLDIKGHASRVAIRRHGLTVQRRHLSRRWRWVLAGVREPRTVVLLGWALADDFVRGVYDPTSDTLALAVPTLRPIRDLWTALLDSGHARMPF